MALDYDRIYIGSGPINLIDAWYHASNGERVCIVDERAKAGGAWASVDHPGLENSEIGCHIWDHDERTYDFLSKLTDSPIAVMSPQPLIHYKGMKVAYDLKNPMFKLKHMAGCFIRGRFGRVFEQLANEFPFPMRLFPAKYKYPAYGSPHFLDALIKKVKAAGVEIRLQHHVTDVEVYSDHVTIKGSHDLSAGQLVVTSFGDLDTIVSAGRKLDLPKRTMRFSHLHLIINDDRKQKIPYIRIWGHPSIHRVSENSLPIGKGQRLILAGIYDHRFKSESDEALAEEVMTYLQQHDLAAKDATMDRFYVNHFDMTGYNGKEQREILIQCGDRIRFMHSTNFTYSIRQHLDKWEELVT